MTNDKYDNAGFSADMVAQIDVALLFRRHSAGLQRFLVSRGIEADAATDVAQEAFVRILGRKPATVPDNPKGYLFRIAANLGVDLLRRNIRRHTAAHVDIHGIQIADDQPGVERIIMSRQDIMILARAFDQIPPIPQKVFLARLDGMTFAEIEQRHGVPIKTAFSQVMKVTLFLKSSMDAAQRTDVE